MGRPKGMAGVLSVKREKGRWGEGYLLEYMVTEFRWLISEKPLASMDGPGVQSCISCPRK